MEHQIIILRPQKFLLLTDLPVKMVITIINHVCQLSSKFSIREFGVVISMRNICSGAYRLQIFLSCHTKKLAPHRRSNKSRASYLFSLCNRLHIPTRNIDFYLRKFSEAPALIANTSRIVKSSRYVVNSSAKRSQTLQNAAVLKVWRELAPLPGYAFLSLKNKGGYFSFCFTNTNQTIHGHRLMHITQ